MAAKVQVIFYSTYGHVWRLAEAVAEGARQVPGANVGIYQVPELVPDEALVRTGAKQARDRFAKIPVAAPEQLTQADAIIFGTPTRYGGVCAQMQNFIDQTGKLWMAGALVGKVGSVFCSTATQHGGQETTLFSLITNLLHFGMVVVGLPYSFQGQMRLDEVTGGAPYGATTIAGGDGSRRPSATELDGARYLGRHVADITAKIAA